MSWRSAAATARSRSTCAFIASRRWCRANCGSKSTERVDGAGRVRTPLAVDEFDALAETLRALRSRRWRSASSIRISTPDHEQAAAAELRRLLPDVFVTTGTELTREWHEFERTATAAANAYVGPQVSKYIAKFDRGLRAGGFAGSLLLMGSHGGVISAERGCREPITLVESGPVGGCIGAAPTGSCSVSTISSPSTWAARRRNAR